MTGYFYKDNLMKIHTYNGKNHHTQHINQNELALQGLPNEPYYIVETDNHIYIYNKANSINSQPKTQELTPKEILTILKEQDLQYHLHLMRTLI